MTRAPLGYMFNQQPLPTRRREVQRPLSGQQRDIHDSRVDQQHQLRDAENDEDQPALLVMRVGLRVDQMRLAPGVGGTHQITVVPPSTTNSWPFT